MITYTNSRDIAQESEILVVDDEQEIADMVAEALIDEGYSVQVAHDGLSALQVIQRKQPDLLILDVMMPRLRGDQLVCRLRTDGTADLPIILMTADRSPERYASLGASSLLHKPFDIGAMLASVSACLGSSVYSGARRLGLRAIERELGA